MKTYAAPAIVLNIYKLVYKYVRIYFLFKYSMYAEGLQINIVHFDTQNGLPWKTLFIFLHLMGFKTISIALQHPKPQILPNTHKYGLCTL